MVSLKKVFGIFIAISNNFPNRSNAIQSLAEKCKVLGGLESVVELELEWNVLLCLILYKLFVFDAKFTNCNSMVY